MQKSIKNQELNHRALHFKLVTEEYMRKKDHLDSWYITELHQMTLKPSDYDELILDVCKVSGIAYVELLSPSRTREVSTVRHIVMYLFTKHFPELTLKKIGSLLGERDHSTVLHSRDNVKKWIDVEISYESELEMLDKLEPLFIEGMPENTDSPR